MLIGWSFTIPPTFVNVMLLSQMMHYPRSLLLFSSSTIFSEAFDWLIALQSYHHCVFNSSLQETAWWNGDFYLISPYKLPCINSQWHLSLLLQEKWNCHIGLSGHHHYSRNDSQNISDAPFLIFKKVIPNLPVSKIGRQIIPVNPSLNCGNIPLQHCILEATSVSNNSLSLTHNGQLTKPFLTEWKLI